MQTQRTLRRMTMKLTRRVLDHSFIRLFACTAYSFPCSVRHAMVGCSAALILSKTHRKEVIVHDINASISLNFNP